MRTQEEIELLALSVAVQCEAMEVESEVSWFKPNPDIFKLRPKQEQSEFDFLADIELAVYILLLKRHNILPTLLYNLYEALPSSREDHMDYNHMFKNDEEFMSFRMKLQEKEHYSNVKRSMLFESMGIFIESKEEIAGVCSVYVKIDKRALKWAAAIVIDEDPVEIQGGRKVLPSLF